MEVMKNITLGAITLLLLGLGFYLGAKLPDMVWLFVLYLFIGIVIIGVLWFVGFIVRLMWNAN